MRGRRPAGPEIVDRLAGSEQARLRLRVVLETLTGRLRVQQACQQLGVGEVRFHEIRQTVLQAALAALEPRPAGRPPRSATSGSLPQQELVERIDELTAQLEAAQLREQIALVLAPANVPSEGGKKNDSTASAATGEEQACRQKLKAWLESVPGPAPSRRGPGKQWLRREVECQLRRGAVRLAAVLLERDWRRGAIAELLGVSERTLRHWQQQQRWGGLRALALGRPTLRSPRQQRQQVLELLGELGPGLGVPTLRECFPQLARAELADLLGRYRRLWRRQHGQVLSKLHWSQPGAVWAMDFAEAPTLIDGLYAYLLAVRDLASGQQLLWQPLSAATAAEVVWALAWLFAEYGPPLVLKSDNGRAFGAGVVQELLVGSGVIALFSPPYWPRYNGSIEAGIGSMKTRTQRQTVLAGRPGQWTWQDTEAARQEANSTARPRGSSGPTAEQLWHSRAPLTPEQREQFLQSVARCRQEVRQEEGQWCEGESTGGQEEGARERKAIQRALVEHGLLSFTRRRIPSPIPRPKVTLFS